MLTGQSTERALVAPSILDAILPLLALIIMLSSAVYFFGDDASYGPNQIALLVACGVAIGVAVKNGHKWAALEDAIATGIKTTANAMLILLMVGALIGAWIVSGTVPTMIYYGLKLINPNAFYITACLVCALSSISIGSSWSVIGTIGLGLFGVATSFGLSPEITAGAIISGAYFGDKMSPLSDTTNLAPAVSGTDLFTHIRHMTWTTVPAITIALILYGLLGFGVDVEASSLGVSNKIQLLEENFGAGLHLLLPVLVVVVLAVGKFPAFPAMMLSTLAGVVIAVIFQWDLLVAFGSAEGIGDVGAMVKGMWTALFSGYTGATPDADMNKLLTRGGMASILNTIWLIVSAMAFGSVMDHAGLLRRLIASLMERAKSSGSLIITTALTCIGVNVVAADQYISIVLPARMYRVEFENRKLAPENLSRTLEDAGTVTSPLIPWNTCGAFISGILGISAFAYAPYCFFNLLSPVLTSLYGVLNFRVTPLEESGEGQPTAMGSVAE